MTVRNRRAAGVAAGVLPPEAAGPRLTLTELLEKWHRYVAGGRASAAGAARQLQRARDVCEGVGANRPADLTPAAVREWLAARRKTNEFKGKSFGAGTAGNYLAAIKSFTRWLALVERSEPVDHLSAVRRQSDPADVRRVRRAISAKELEKLLEATRKSGEVIYGLTGVREARALPPRLLHGPAGIGAGEPHPRLVHQRDRRDRGEAREEPEA